MVQDGIERIIFDFLHPGLNDSTGILGRALCRPDANEAVLTAQRDQGRSCVTGIGRADEAGRSSTLTQIAGGTPGALPQVIARRLLKAAAALGLIALTATSAIMVKEMRVGNVQPLPAVSVQEVSFAEVAGIPVPAAVREVAKAAPVQPKVAAPVVEPAQAKAEAPKPKVKRAIWPKGTRFFNGRPIRPVKTMKMVVTAYSPDARSCGTSADGITATLHSVQTNAHRLVASDPRVLPYGSMLSIPGYDSGNVVPVLDCGGAIKGNRLDLLFPTHEQARKWGRKTVTVTVWGYADGKPAPNPRKARDGKK